MFNYADCATAALKKQFGTMWQAAQAYDSTWSGGRMRTELLKDAPAPGLVAFVEMYTGVKPLAIIG